MKLVKLALIAALVPACGKPSDLARMQEESNLEIRHKLPEVTELNARLQAVRQRQKRVTTQTPDSAIANQLADRAGTLINKLKNEIEHGEAMFAAAAKRGETDRDRTEALQAEIDKLNELVENELTEATTHVSTVEQWVARAEVAPPPPPAPTEVHTDTPPPTP